MKITKDEASLYKMLNIINAIFGKSKSRTEIVGSESELYFFTEDYCGLFASKDGDRLIEPYDFENCLYELKQLPDKKFVLDKTIDNQSLREDIKNFVKRRVQTMSWKMTLGKDYEHKIAKIAVETKKWMKDGDMSYLKAFPVFEIFTVDDGLLIKYENQFSKSYIIFLDSIVNPDIDDSTQMKLDAYITDTEETNDYAETIEEAPEEFEDEFDPMA